MRVLLPVLARAVVPAQFNELALRVVREVLQTGPHSAQAVVTILCAILSDETVSLFVLFCLIVVAEQGKFNAAPRLRYVAVGDVF